MLDQGRHIRPWTYLLVFLAAGAPPATAGSTILSVKYEANFSGIAVGKATMNVSVNGDRYTVQAYGKTVFVAKLMSAGKGGASAAGSMGETRPIPASFELRAIEDRQKNVVVMRMRNGAINHLVADPKLRPHPLRIPVTAAHKRNVVDPVSAALMRVPGSGSIKGPDACNRTIPIFDGRQRFDVVLQFVRTEIVRGKKGSYSGPVVVCRMGYRPVSGHRSNRRVNMEMVQNKDLFIWLAPIGRTRVLAPWRIQVGLPYGKLTITAERFLVVENG